MKRQFKVSTKLLDLNSLPLKKLNEFKIEVTMTKDEIIFSWEEQEVDNEDPFVVAFSIGLLIGNIK